MANWKLTLDPVIVIKVAENPDDKTVPSTVELDFPDNMGPALFQNLISQLRTQFAAQIRASAPVKTGAKTAESADTAHAQVQAHEQAIPSPIRPATDKASPAVSAVRPVRGAAPRHMPPSPSMARRMASIEAATTGAVQGTQATTGKDAPKRHVVASSSAARRGLTK